MADTPQSVERKRYFYLQLMRKAQLLDDQILVKMILRKLTALGTAGAVSTAGGCTVIPFPLGHTPVEPTAPELPMWWVLVKLTLAIPGSLAALLMLAVYRL
ncbi:MAG: hypothetical protein JRF38_00085 [Deltaproteobacteria bacterium]|nr:hypothetical protein [Deltaproteobacteria bacterium]